MKKWPLTFNIRIVISAAGAAQPAHPLSSTCLLNLEPAECNFLRARPRRDKQTASCNVLNRQDTFWPRQAAGASQDSQMQSSLFGNTREAMWLLPLLHTPRICCISDWGQVLLAGVPVTHQGCIFSSVFVSPPFVSANYSSFSILPVYFFFLSSTKQLRLRLFTPAALDTPPAPTGHQARLDTDRREERACNFSISHDLSACSYLSPGMWCESTLRGMTGGSVGGGGGPSGLTELWRRWAGSQSNRIKSWSSPPLLAFMSCQPLWLVGVFSLLEGLETHGRTEYKRWKSCASDASGCLLRCRAFREGGHKQKNEDLHSGTKWKAE